MARDQGYYFQFNFDYGQVTITVPDKLSEADCNDLEAHFAIIMRQCRRRQIDVKGDGEPSDGL